MEKRKTEITPLLSTIGMMLLITAAVLSLLWWHRSVKDQVCSAGSADAGSGQ